MEEFKDRERLCLLCMVTFDLEKHMICILGEESRFVDVVMVCRNYHKGLYEVSQLSF